MRWVCRGYHYVDPQKEIAAQKAAVRSGFKTLADCVAENGGDFDEFLVARESELAKLDEMNIITDTDPSAVNAAALASTSRPTPLTPLVTRLRLVARMQKTLGGRSWQLLTAQRLT